MKKAFNFILLGLSVIMFCISVYLLVCEIILCVACVTKKNDIFPMDWFFTQWAYDMSFYGGIYFKELHSNLSELPLIQRSIFLKVPTYLLSAGISLYFASKKLNKILNDKPIAFLKKKMEKRKAKHEENKQVKKQSKLEKLKKKIQEIEGES